MRHRNWVFLFLNFVLFSFPTHAETTRKLQVVVSFSILADMVHQVGGENIEIHTLVAPGNDTHVFEPTPADVVKVKNAELVIINGLGFEGWIARLVASSGYKGTVIEATKGAVLIGMEHEHDHEPQPERKRIDPHAWQDVSNAIQYVANISSALKAADPVNAALYDKNAAEYSSELEALDTEIKMMLSSIPPERRKVITSHDAFGYYAKAYGVVFLAPLGMNTDAEASAKGIARLIDQIRTEKITALFIENISSRRQIEQLQADSGVSLGGMLYSDALCKPPCEAATYLDMMRSNTRQLAAAMQQNPAKK